MKVNQLFENDAKMTKYYRVLRRYAANLIPVNSQFFDNLEDMSLGPVGSNRFMAYIELNMDFNAMDLSSLYSGSRKIRRDLQQKALRLQAPKLEEFEEFKSQLNRLVKRWVMYGLQYVYVVPKADNHPGYNEDKAVQIDAADFDSNQVLKLDETNKIRCLLRFMFVDDGSLNV